MSHFNTNDYIIECVKMYTRTLNSIIYSEKYGLVDFNTIEIKRDLMTGDYIITFIFVQDKTKIRIPVIISDFDMLDRRMYAKIKRELDNELHGTKEVL